MTITKDQIFAVADELNAVGQNPTLAAVRKALGSGSFTTISEAMNEWRARKTTEAAPIREPTPQAVKDKLVGLGADLWAVALELANSRLAAEREALELAHTDMAAKQQEAAELADQLTIDLDDVTARAETLEVAIATSKVEAEELRAKLASAGERTATAEARAGELRTELDHAHREAVAVRAEHKAALSGQQEAIVRVRTDLDKATEQNRSLADRLQAVTAELAAVKAKVETAELAHQEQRKQAAAEAHRMAERMTRAQAERDAARKEANAAREEAAAFRGRVKALETLVPANRKGGAKKT